MISKTPRSNPSSINPEKPENVEDAFQLLGNQLSRESRKITLEKDNKNPKYKKIHTTFKERVKKLWNVNK